LRHLGEKFGHWARGRITNNLRKAHPEREKNAPSGRKGQSKPEKVRKKKNKAGKAQNGLSTWMKEDTTAHKKKRGKGKNILMDSLGKYFKPEMGSATGGGGDLQAAYKGRWELKRSTRGKKSD